MGFDVGSQGEALVHPAQPSGHVFFDIIIHGYATSLLCSPINNISSLKYSCGGTIRLIGAGEPLNTRPAKSNLEPWQGQKKPPCQSSPISPLGCSLGDGEQPRCVHTPSITI